MFGGLINATEARHEAQEARATDDEDRVVIHAAEYAKARQIDAHGFLDLIDVLDLGDALVRVTRERGNGGHEVQD
jgi:hypothetical protein